eukprot:TRINITY_DN67867_c0_g1_i1.p1 TRINITY_DN67867_c0_g1~~TRINITY_DN67867_c0_g1_i1.p1  ORF type:complete len:297 (-),score=51.33 TRINITY_DN67867_c0_g1_i1:264-1154(-)
MDPPYGAPPPSPQQFVDTNDDDKNTEPMIMNLGGTGSRHHHPPAPAELRKAQEAHSSSGGYARVMVFGGLDGIITTFAVVAAAAGGLGSDVSAHLVLIFGVANLIADGFSMGFGEFISGRTEQDFIKSERKREEWEMDNFPEGEKEEMIEIYTGKGLAREDAQQVVDLLASTPSLFVDIMMVEELGLVGEGDDSMVDTLKNAAVMFGSFMLFGAVPLLAYAPGKGGIGAFMVSIGLTLTTLFLLGCVKGKLTSSGILKSGLLMLLNGGIAAAISYGAAALIDVIFGGDPLSEDCDA